MEDGINKMPNRIGQNMKQGRFQLTFDGIVMALVLILANLRALMFFTLYPEASTLLSPAWIEIYFWLLAALGILYLLIRDHRVTEYLLVWQRNWLLGLFVIL